MEAKPTFLLYSVNIHVVFSTPNEYKLVLFEQMFLKNSQKTNRTNKPERQFEEVP